MSELDKHSNIEDNTLTAKSSWGGARAGAGRKKGSTALITAATLLKAIEDTSGKSFEQHLAEGYTDAVVNNDKKIRLEYERMILGKTVAERMAVEIEESEDAINAKQQAFTEALNTLRNLQSNDK